MGKYMHHTSFVLRTFYFVLAAALAVSAASAARPVARWDVVPDQRISGVFNAGVCAFNEDGVSVEFSVDGKVMHVADAPALNPRTGVWEYVFPVDTATLADGPVILGARAITKGASSEEYDLPPLPLYANSGGSLTVADTLWVDAAKGDDAADGTKAAPLCTLAAAVKRMKAGGTILLMAGEYSSDGLNGGSKRPYWTTITAAPGVDRDDVQIGPGRPGTQRLRFRGVTLYCDAKSGYATILAGENGNNSVWLDDCKCYNRQGRWSANSNVFGNRYVGYVTGGITTEMNNGPGADLIRDHEVRRIASDVWTGSNKLVVNCTATDVDAGSTGAHPDFHQSYAVEPGWVHDVILYNVTGYNCRCQGLFGLRLRDSAFVNVVFERTEDTKFYTQYSGPMDNVLFAHVTLLNQTWAWRASFSPSDVRVINCCMREMAEWSDAHLDGSGTNGLLVSNCFFYNEKGRFGLNALSGDPGFADPSASDYSFRPDSPALANFRPLQCVPIDFRGKPFRDASWKVDEVNMDHAWRFADCAAIKSGSARLYRATGNRRNVTVGVNAGHGTDGGQSVKTYCHPDRSPKVTGGTTAAGAIMAVAVSGGMTFKDGTKEAQVTLEAARLLRDGLLANGYDVLMLRDGDDVQLDNVARTVIANNVADCLISLHWDGDGLGYDKGCFYISVPEGLKNMVPVSERWREHEKLGAALIAGLGVKGCRIHGDGKVAIDLTQTSYSTIPSVDVELGNQCSTHDNAALSTIAEGLLEGVEAFFGPAETP